MICSSSLTDDLTPLVLDTSVLINLHASSFGEKILAMVPNAFAIPEIVMRELGHETSRINGQQHFLESLIARQKVRLVPLDDAGWVIFERLTASTPSLGDGEAATIAIALTTAHRPVIDDAKGRKSAEALMRAGSAAWTLDLLVHTNVQKGLGNNGDDV